MIFQHPLSRDDQSEIQRNVFSSGYEAGIPVRFLDLQKTYNSHIASGHPKSAEFVRAKAAFLNPEFKLNIPNGIGLRFEGMCEETFALFARNLLQYEHKPVKYIEVGDLLVKRSQGIYTEDGLGSFVVFIRGFYKPDNPHAYQGDKREYLSEGVRFFIRRGHPLFLSYDGSFLEARNWYDERLISELLEICPPI